MPPGFRRRIGRSVRISVGAVSLRAAAFAAVAPIPLSAAVRLPLAAVFFLSAGRRGVTILTAAGTAFRVGTAGIGVALSAAFAA